jgi:phospholipid/cholesterol/gamma-HCH transport system substrate-binding protein
MVKLTNEIKTGVVVVAAALLLLFVVYKIGGIKTEEGYEVKCAFTYVSGLEENAPVKLAGVKAGEVKSVGCSYDGDETKVLVTLEMDEKARIREDSKIRISTTGLIGEKYIEITGGSKGSPFVNKGALLTGIDPFEIEELIETGRTLAARIDLGVQDLQKLVGHVDGVLIDNKDDIRTAIVNLKDTSQNFKEFSDDIKRNPWKLIIKQKEVKKSDAIETKQNWR